MIRRLAAAACAVIALGAWRPLLGGEIICRSEYGKGSRFSLALQESA
ncbi:MAG: hypothetical protein AABO58_11445 [Acidobacteriota bacterium]